jgi:predicted SAM-dependent methyltransferase
MSMLTRPEKLLQCIDPAHQVGIEIGPLDKPIVTREMGKIHYIDHDTTEALRAKYAEFSNVETSKIVDVDHIWGKESLVELLRDEEQFDYAIASHVIEHVPNFIGWLSEVRAILKTGGILSLAIPDKRQCFDYHRNPTRLAEVVEAYLRHSKQPTPRQIFDHYSSAVSNQGHIAWNEQVDGTQLALCHSAAEAWEIAKTNFSKGDYCDVHCWVFTPASFFHLLSELAKLDLLKFEVAQFYRTEGCEFLVSLRATDVAKPAELSDFAASLAPGGSAFIPHRAENQYAENGSASAQIFQERIQAMESSKFWKIRTTWFKVKQKLGLPNHEP